HVSASVLNMLCKACIMTGRRVCKMMVNAENLSAVLKVKSIMDSGMFYGIQKGAVAALQSSQDWYKNLNRVYKKRRDLIFKLADKLNCSYDKNAVGMFVWAKLPAGIDSAEKF